MKLNFTRVKIDSLAELLQKHPNKMHTKISNAGIAVAEDGTAGLEDVQLMLMDLDEDWDALVAVETEPVGEASSRGNRLYDNLAKVFLGRAAEKLTAPTDPDRIRRLARFLDENEDFAASAELWAAAYHAAQAGLITGDSSFEREAELSFALSQAKMYMQAGQYEHASEMAFAALACHRVGSCLEDQDERVILYLLGLLMAAGAASSSRWQEYKASELIELGLESNQRTTIERLRNAVQRALFWYDNFVESLDLPRKIRIELRKSLDVLKGDLELNPNFQGEDFYTQLAQQITGYVADLKSTVEACLRAKGYIGVEQQRPRLITRLKEIHRFATPTEQEALDALLDLLKNSLTTLDRNRRGGNVREYGQAHKDIQARIDNVAWQIEAKPGWLSSCFVLPTLHWLEECLDLDFHDRTSEYTTVVSLSLSKKAYPLKAGESHTLMIATQNDGNSEAEKVMVDFRSTPDIELSPARLEFGNLAIGAKSGEYPLKVRVSTERAVYEAPYTLSWNNLTGETTTQSDTLKILPQKQIDWDNLSDNPYIISSIKEYQPDKLKGRSDKLLALRMGLSSMQSFFITGQKRVGKSSIANVYYGELLKRPEVLPVRFLWGDVADCDLPMLGEAMCRFVKDAWRDKTETEMPFQVPTIEEFQKSFSLTFTGYLMAFHRHYPTWKLIFVIDDFDEIREELYKGDKGDAFFTTLRAFIDRDFTSFIIVGSEGLSVILREQGRKVNQADTLEVDYLDNRKDLEELISEPAKEVLFFDQDAIVEAIKLTAGNPYYANLLCSRIFRLMVAERDYYVSPRDVVRAGELLAREDKEKSYSHFWTDGIRDVGTDKDRIAYSNAMTLIALSKSEADAGGYVDIRTVYQQPEVRYLETAELEYRLNELADRKVLERDPAFPTHFRIKVKLFQQWLQADGAHQIRQSFGEVEHTIRPMKNYALFPEELVQVADGLVYRGENVDRIAVESWLRQFGDDYNQRLAYKVLCALKERGYYSTAKFNNALSDLLKMAIARTSGWNKVVDSKLRLARNVLVSHVDPMGKSGSALVTDFRQANQIYYKNCGSLEDIANILAGNSEESTQFKPGERWLLLMVDDFVGSGNSGAEYIVKALETLDQQASGWETRCHAFYAFVCGFEKGAEVVAAAANHRVDVIIANPLTEKDRAFSGQAEIFQDDRERASAKALFQRIGISLEKKHPMGHEDSEALVVFPKNVPNNTLPVFYKKDGRYEGKLWVPLFLRV